MGKILLFVIFTFAVSALSHEADILRQCKEKGRINLIIGEAINCSVTQPTNKE